MPSASAPAGPGTAARRAVALAACALALAACQPGADLSDRRRDTDALAQTLPVLAALRVEAFRDQDWCRTIAYRGGRFSSNPRRATCNTFAGPPARLPQVPPGEPGFQTVRDSLRRAQSRGGPDVRRLEAAFDPDGRLRGAEFVLDCPWPFCKGSYTYVFAPAGPAPEAASRTTAVAPAGPGWYLVHEVD